jgi:hypothetical protein
MKTRKDHPVVSKILSVLIATAILAGYILLSNPNTVALPLLLVPFVIIGYILYEVTSLIVHIFVREHSNLVARMLPSSVGFVGVGLMILSSLHQLSWKDTLLVALFTGLFWLYIWRADFLHKKS